MYTQFYRIKGGCGSGHPSTPSPIIFEQQILPQQTIYRWKGNLTASRIHFKYWKTILIWRLYEQFSRNDSAMAPEWLSEKISNFKNMNILYIYVSLKHVTWRFRICNYFREIFKFRDFNEHFKKFPEICFAQISAKFKYFAKQFLLTESPDHVLQNDI